MSEWYEFAMISWRHPDQPEWWGFTFCDGRIAYGWPENPPPGLLATRGRIVVEAQDSSDAEWQLMSKILDFGARPLPKWRSELARVALLRRVAEVVKTVPADPHNKRACEQACWQMQQIQRLLLEHIDLWRAEP